MSDEPFEVTTEKVYRKFLTLGHTLYLRELWQRDRLQWQFGMRVPLSDWQLLWNALGDLIETGQLVAYEDDVQGIGIVSLDLWLSDVEADPSLKELRINRLPRDTKDLIGVMRK